jgi:hypothetical protein
MVQESDSCRNLYRLDGAFSVGCPGLATDVDAHDVTTVKVDVDIDASLACLSGDRS